MTTLIIIVLAANLFVVGLALIMVVEAMLVLAGAFKDMAEYDYDPDPPEMTEAAEAKVVDLSKRRNAA